MDWWGLLNSLIGTILVSSEGISIVNRFTVGTRWENGWEVIVLYIALAEWSNKKGLQVSILTAHI